MPAAPAAGLQLHPARRGLPGPLPAAHSELPRGVSAGGGEDWGWGQSPAVPGGLQQTSALSSRRKVKRVLFVPYALHDRDAYARTAREKFESLGKGGPEGGRGQGSSGESCFSSGQRGGDSSRERAACKLSPTSGYFRGLREKACCKHL